MKKTWIAMLTVGVLLLSACAQETDDAASPVPSGEDPCSVDNLPVMEPGTLTIATDSPAYGPWFEKNDPSNGMGYESAVAYAVADRLGFSADSVKWVVEPFNKSYAPGSKDFDFDINQISITTKRAKVVDFSEGYYDVNQALIALKSSPVAGATTIAEVADAKLGTGGNDQPGLHPGEHPAHPAAVRVRHDQRREVGVGGRTDRRDRR